MAFLLIRTNIKLSACGALTSCAYGIFVYAIMPEIQGCYPVHAKPRIICRCSHSQRPRDHGREASTPVDPVHLRKGFEVWNGAKDALKYTTLRADSSKKQSISPSGHYSVNTLSYSTLEYIYMTASTRGSPSVMVCSFIATHRRLILPSQMFHARGNEKRRENKF